METTKTIKLNLKQKNFLIYLNTEIYGTKSTKYNCVKDWNKDQYSSAPMYLQTSQKTGKNIYLANIKDWNGYIKQIALNL